ncbi:MAG TPA: TIGR03013 family XrtA/PEP-CTERM system glycosyltransferase [Spongiibacteraceae bacterium]
MPTPLALLATLEYAALVAAIYMAHWLRFAVLDSGTITVEIGPRAHLFAIVNFLSLIAIGAYRPRNKEGLSGSVLRAVVAIFLIGTFVLSATFYMFPAFEIYFGRGVLALAAMLAVVMIAILRDGFRRLSNVGALKWCVMVIGAGTKAKHLSDLIATKDSSDLSMAGFYPVTDGGHLIDPSHLLNSERPIRELAHELGVQEIVVAVDERRRREGSNGYPLEALLDCKLDGIRVSEDISFLERETGRLDIRSLSPGWLVFSEGFSYSPIRDGLERLFDLVASSLLLILTWPFMLLAVVAIKLEEGINAPLIYSQERVGYGGRIFHVHKFRSMRVDAEKDGKARWAQKNDSRITRVGAFIRNTRIDELPQIFNVLKGEMSFVGPRPERPQFVEELAAQIPYFRERHRVKPGITGWAQISYPYGASVKDSEEKLKYDLYYIKNHSLFFDLFILVRTVEIILLGSGVR